MTIKRSARLSLVELRRKPYQPPRDPGFVRDKLRNRVADWRGARAIGQAVAEGHDLTDGSQFHYEGTLDELANKALADTREGHQDAAANTASVAEDARQQKDDAEARIEQLEEEDREDRETERQRSHLRGLGFFSYCLISAFCYLALLPQDMAAATGLPLAPFMQLVVAFTIGGILAVLAPHFAGDKWHEMDEARVTRAANPGLFERLKKELLVAIAIPVLVIVGIAVWRGKTFAAESETVGELFMDPQIANVAFALLAISAFLVACLAARAYCRLKPLREIKRKRRRNARSRKRQQRVADFAERLEAQARLHLDHLSVHLGKVEDKVGAVLATRRKYLRHRAGVIERKHRKRLIHKGLLPPHPGAAARQSPARAGTSPGGSPAVDIERLAREVRMSSNGQGRQAR